MIVCPIWRTSCFYLSSKWSDISVCYKDLTNKGVSKAQSLQLQIIEAMPCLSHWILKGLPIVDTEHFEDGAMLSSSIYQICTSLWGRFKRTSFNGPGIDSKPRSIWEEWVWKAGCGAPNWTTSFIARALEGVSTFTLFFLNSFSSPCTLNNPFPACACKFCSFLWSNVVVFRRKGDSGFDVTVDCTELRGWAHFPPKFLLCL